MARKRYSDQRRNNTSYSDDYYIGLSFEYGQMDSAEASRRRRARKRAAEKRRRNNRIKLIAMAVAFMAVVVTIVVLISSCIAGGSEQTNGFTVVKTDDKKKTDSKSKVANNGNDLLNPLNFVVPDIKDDKSKGSFSSQNGAVYIWNKSAYEIFGSSADRSDMYADAINKAGKKLGDKIKVYSIIIPLHAEMSLPERLKNETGCSSQADNIYNAYSKFDKSVQAINVYNQLAIHNNEYIYFNSDHHWTGLGAYYAYTAFCEQTKQEPMTISEEGTNKIEGFTGSFHTYGTGLTDTVYYYDLPYTTQCTLYASPDSEGQPADVYYKDEQGGENSYGVFINGDQPKFIIESDCESDKKIAVIKESFGNAFVPYLSANYSEVHVLDMRYSGVTDLKAYCEENEITEVLFINNMMSANTSDRVSDIENIIG